MKFALRTAKETKEEKRLRKKMEKEMGMHHVRQTDYDIMEEIWSTTHHMNHREELKNKLWPLEEDNKPDY